MLIRSICGMLFVVAIAAGVSSGRSGLIAAVVIGGQPSGFAAVRFDEVLQTASGDSGDSREHWSFCPVQRAELPNVTDSQWPLDALDRFILAELERQQLAPAREADRYTWLRRVSFDLTGLPPTPREIAEFIDDPSSQAYERVVDRL